ncbi:ABC transporter permease (plasmid) [Deinococcus metallilatus]|uniref:ABC transporter permease n=1 Tax=Deinococcus metallilatus TaxID=1211322 RepID=A0AAJ5JZW0_9DEIO|nr:ABC transporter permease [Deinococcus metallilatus]MBB5295717.1 peptide/nickel transport system permease protein [Deinococcus metallilatus]QBY06835.1 ABC transporter permease [Deinococcus metallilatus]TLK32224.1 ABC transporter permease [Deinococcus metallilatus]GMA14248.1 nickel ABC transporter permease [Deinococcus metallilatus]
MVTSTRKSVTPDRRWLFLRRNKLGLIGLLIITAVLFAAVFAPAIAPYGVDSRDFRARFAGPSAAHLLGTDNFGRDTLSRIVYGSRVSVQVAVIAVGLSAVIGVLAGAFAGFFGGLVDTLVMRTVDVFLAFPPILLALALVAALGPSAQSVMVALGMVYWTTYARVIRSSILAIREEDYVDASRALGASPLRTLFRHVLPNALGPVIVIATVGMGNAITAEASLSFLGLGVQPPTPSWGSILNTGLQFLRQGPLLSVFAGLAIMLTVLGFNLLGDALRDLLDPRKVSA